MIRHREVGRNFGVLARGARIQFIDQHVGDLCSEIKLRNRRSTGCTRTQDRGKLPLDQIETFAVHESQFNKFSHADGLKSIPLLKKKRI